MRQTKLSIYKSRTNQIENVSGEDLLSVFMSLVKARVRASSRFLPLKRKFFLATVAKGLLMVGIVGSL